MKKNFINVAMIATLAASFIFCSCDKEENVEIMNSNEQITELPIECELVDVNTILTISKNMEAMVDSLQSIEMTRGTAALSTSPYAQMSEAQIKKELQPLVNNGKQIQSALISAVNNPAYGLELTTAEYEALKTLDDVQLAQLSMQLSLVYAPENFKQISGLQITTKMFVDCLLQASGIGIIINTGQAIAEGGIGALTGGILNNKLLTGKAAMNLFRGVVSHYLGWFGVIYTIVEFGNCIKSKQ